MCNDNDDDEAASDDQLRWQEKERPVEPIDLGEGVCEVASGAQQAKVPSAAGCITKQLY